MPTYTAWDRRALSSRNVEVALLRRRGATLQAVGDAVGVTPERVRQIEAKVARKQRIWRAMVTVGVPLPDEAWAQFRRLEDGR